MLRSMNDIEQYTIGATDGDIGRVTDLYLDDNSWVVRFLVVETGEWLVRRKVLISPMSISNPVWQGLRLNVGITRQQVKGSPGIDTERPVSRQHEGNILGYYGYPYYWGGLGMWGDSDYPGAMLENDVRRQHALEENSGKHSDLHLRSCKEVIGYHIHALDGEIGHVCEMLVDEDTWAVRYLVVDTSNWWMGHQVLVSPVWINKVSWSQRQVTVDLRREAVKTSPAYSTAEVLNRDTEERLFQHYGRTGRWPSKVA